MPEQTRTAAMTAPTRDIHASWAANNPILPEGVFAITKNRLYTGSVEFFIGDGVHTYNELQKFGCTTDGDGKILIEQLPSSVLTSTSKNTANGIAGLDATGKIQMAQLPSNILTTTHRGAANGVASLDGSAKIPVSQIPTKILTAEPDADDLAEGEVAYVVEA